MNSTERTILRDLVEVLQLLTKPIRYSVFKSAIQDDD